MHKKEFLSQWDKILASVIYGSKGDLEGIDIAPIFLDQPEEKGDIYFIDSPRFALVSPIDNNKVKAIDKFYFFTQSMGSDVNVEKKEYITSNFVLRKLREQAIDVFDNSNQQVFEIEWDTKQADKEEDTGNYLLVSQRHIPTDIVKTLKLPLRVDLAKVAESLNSRPPYNRERVGGRERLVVPWRNIDRIVGASLSYSYPPEKQS